MNLIGLCLIGKMFIDANWDLNGLSPPYIDSANILIQLCPSLLVVVTIILLPQTVKCISRYKH